MLLNQGLFIEGQNSFLHSDSGFLQSTTGLHMNLDYENEAELKLAKNRERNREHARCTRVRKKAQLQGLIEKLEKLQAESQRLKQTLSECNTASILLGLSSGESSSAFFDIDFSTLKAGEKSTHLCLTGKRKRFVSDASDYGPQPMELVIRGKATIIGGTNSKAHINWKTGVFVDEDGSQKQLSSGEVDALRRERNRMHAKMTRDRKKNFVKTVNRTIRDLEVENNRIKEILEQQAQKNSSLKKYIVTSPLGEPLATPSASGMITPTGPRVLTPSSSQVVSPISTPVPKKDGSQLSLLLSNIQAPLPYPPAFVTFQPSHQQTSKDIKDLGQASISIPEGQGLRVVT